MSVRATGRARVAPGSVQPVVELPEGVVEDLVDEIGEELDTLEDRRAAARRDPATELAMAPARTAARGRTAGPPGGTEPSSPATPDRSARPTARPRSAPTGRAAEGLVAPGVPAVNEVRIVGRISTGAEEHELPSGDVLVSLRVVVPRPASRTVGDRRRPRVPVDTIEVACWSAMTRRRALKLEGGELVEVTGSLRRRFYRAGTVSLSRYEVEARTLRKVREVVAVDEVTQEVTEEAVGE